MERQKKQREETLTQVLRYVTMDTSSAASCSVTLESYEVFILSQGYRQSSFYPEGEQ